MGPKLPDSYVNPDRVIAGAAYTPYCFGASLATFGGDLLIGAPYRYYYEHSAEGAPPPAACLFVRDGRDWKISQVLIAPDPPECEYFAGSLALGASHAVVGAPGHENVDGPVHDFRRTAAGVELRAVYDWPGRKTEFDEALEQFGWSVAADDRSLLVSATLSEGPAGENAGVVHVFDREVDSRAPAREVCGRYPGETFGAALALSRDLLVVGADAAYSAEGLAGAAYVFRREGSGGWRELCRVTGRTPREQFGSSVAVDGRRFAVAVRGRTNENEGRVELFELDGDRAHKTAVIESDCFVNSVALLGNRLAIGQANYAAPGGPPRTGRVGLFRIGDTGILESEGWLVAPEAAEDSFLGTTVVLGDDFVAAGAPGSDEELRESAFVAIKNW